MFFHHALQHRPHIPRRHEIAALIERAARETGPVCDYSPTTHRPADKKRRGGCAVIGPARAVYRGGAAEFSRQQYGGVIPYGAELLFEGAEPGIERRKSARQLALRGAFVRVSVPTGGVEHRNFGAVVTAEEFRARYAEVSQAAAEFLRREDGPKVAVFDTTGWDTHANEGVAQGQLAGRLAALDSGLRTLKEQLGPVWSDTAVLLATEFGRTAAINGTRGTDHGTATAAFLVGGAVRGGRVIADWPGLSSRALYQGRDLMPTQDMRSVLKGVMEEHLSIPARALDTTVFPDSGAAKALSGLVRT